MGGIAETPSSATGTANRLAAPAPVVTHHRRAGVERGAPADAERLAGGVATRLTGAMAAIIAGPAASTGRALRVGSHTYPLVLPSLADPRLHLAGVIFSLQVLGQVALGFELSIAQILVSLATVAVLEVTITFWQRRAIEWPASALLTGNGVAFIFRVPGTAHGDWWSMRGAHLFAAVAAISLLSKYLITYRGGHLFNPSNLGLVVSFLILGPRLANPQDLWWGPMSIGLGITLALIVCGGLLIASRLRLLGIAVAFWLTYAFGMGVLWAFGHCMTARWNVGPVCGASFWTVLVTSPEILVFLFFMITDPKTVPGGRVSRIVYGIGVGVVAAVLASAQRTEFATKVSILASLVIVCALRPVIERLAPAAHSEGDRLRAWREVEVEMGPAARQPSRTLRRRLRAAGASPSQYSSTLE